MSWFRRAVGRGQHDPAPQRQRLTGRRASSPPLQRLTLVIAQHDLRCRSSSSSHRCLPSSLTARCGRTRDTSRRHERAEDAGHGCHHRAAPLIAGPGRDALGTQPWACQSHPRRAMRSRRGADRACVGSSSPPGPRPHSSVVVTRPCSSPVTSTIDVHERRSRPAVDSSPARWTMIGEDSARPWLIASTGTGGCGRQPVLLEAAQRPARRTGVDRASRTPGRTGEHVEHRADLVAEDLAHDHTGRVEPAGRPADEVGDRHLAVTLGRRRPAVQGDDVGQAGAGVETELGDERLDRHDTLMRRDRVETHRPQERGPCRLDGWLRHNQLPCFDRQLWRGRPPRRRVQRKWRPPPERPVGALARVSSASRIRCARRPPAELSAFRLSAEIFRSSR